eukprot:maker-scaffold340_size202118-snap-gene-0.17 protein:Tk00670 transcript:maker-scaffold340_size202118-snap-gene-0.17-mRNA-1 annotation:"hypothetical protein"
MATASPKMIPPAESQSVRSPREDSLRAKNDDYGLYVVLPSVGSKELIERSKCCFEVSANMRHSSCSQKRTAWMMKESTSCGRRWLKITRASGQHTYPKCFTVVASLLVASVAADSPYQPAPYQPAPYQAEPAYKPAPYRPEPAYKPHPSPSYKPDPYHDEQPKNYAYGYDVKEYDEYGNANVHSKHEERDGYTVKGQYTVQLPDCRTQIVDYYVDEHQAYHADVKYEGEICEDKSVKHYQTQQGYKAEPAYKSAPAPYKPAPYKPAPYKPAPYKAEPAYKPAPYKPAPAPYKAEPAYQPAPYKAEPAYQPAPYKAEPAYQPAPYKPEPAYQPAPYSPYQA